MWFSQSVLKFDVCRGDLKFKCCQTERSPDKNSVKGLEGSANQEAADGAGGKWREGSISWPPRDMTSTHTFQSFVPRARLVTCSSFSNTSDRSASASCCKRSRLAGQDSLYQHPQTPGGPAASIRLDTRSRTDTMLETLKGAWKKSLSKL